MSTAAFTGSGGSVSIATAGGAAFTPIAQIKTATFSAPKANFADVTSISSPGSVKEQLPTVIDPGHLTLAVIANQQDAGQLMLAAGFYAKTLLTVKVQYPPQPGMNTGLLRTFNGYVSTNGLADLNAEQASTYSVELTISGQITDTPGA